MFLYVLGPLCWLRVFRFVDGNFSRFVLYVFHDVKTVAKDAGMLQCIRAWQKIGHLLQWAFWWTRKCAVVGVNPALAA